MDFKQFNNLSDIIITIPQSIIWSDYQRELLAATKGEVLNFKVANFPKTGVGKRCYILHAGFIRGYMLISGLQEKSFKCTTTGKNWTGKFVERTGRFYPIEPIPMKGFQGFRYFK